MCAMNLPIEFENRMKQLLGDQYADYIESFNQPASKAVHLNTNICQSHRLLSDFQDFEPLSYSDNAFKSNIEKIGTHPLHHAGVVYSQDPGALMPVSSLPFDFSSDDIVLDMCSAPGGKSSQLAIKLAKVGGYLVSNEINKSRNTILRSNLERMGYDNHLLVTCMSSEEIAANFPHTFSFILVDAPCSGEGMFRKYPESIDEWSVSNVLMCSERQKEILDNAMIALKPGGYLLYSTCTYSREENEDIIQYLLEKYNLELSPMSPAILDYSTSLGNEPGAHFFPHIAYGEGQYMCLLKSKEELADSNLMLHAPSMTKAGKNIYKIIKDSFNDDLIDTLTIYQDKENLYIIDNLPYIIPRNGVTRLGVYMGQIIKNRFEPSHMFFKVYGSKMSNVIDLSSDTELAYKYLKGEELYIENAPKGYGAFSYYGGILGGFKSANGRLKNHYPKGLRNNN